MCSTWNLQEHLECTNLLSAGKWQVLSTRVCNVLKMFSLVSRPPRPQCPEDSDPENNAALCTEELEACIEAFLEEVEEDLEMNNLPPLENTSPLPLPAPVFSSFVPFTISTGQHCVPPKSLLRRVYHPYRDPVGQCCCDPGGWCDNLPCSGQKRHVPRKIRGRNSSHGSSWLG